jgi:hypothetical protein
MQQIGIAMLEIARGAGPKMSSLVTLNWTGTYEKHN